MKKIIFFSGLFTLLAFAGLASITSVEPVAAKLSAAENLSKQILLPEPGPEKAFDPCTKETSTPLKWTAKKKTRVLHSVPKGSVKQQLAVGRQHSVMVDDGKDVLYFDRSEIEWDVLIPAKQ